MVRTCWTCGGYGSVSGFWLGTRKKCPACGGKGHFEIVTSSSGAGTNVTIHHYFARPVLRKRPSLLRRLARWLRGLSS